MARNIKVSNKRKNSRFSALVSEGVQAFIARRVIDAAGLLFVLTGLAVLAALISYDHGDPSWNTAPAEGAVANWLGRPGANLADILIQTMGLGGAVFGIVPAVWGWRLLRRMPVGPLWLRAVAMIVAAVLAATALARVPSGGWSVGPYSGGGAGALILDRTESLIHGAVPDYGHMAVAAAAALAGIAAFACALGVSLSGWAMLGAFIARSAWFVCALSYALCARFAAWVRHYADADFDPPARPSLPHFDLGYFLGRKNELQLEEDEEEEEGKDEEGFDDAPVRRPARQKSAPRISPPVSASDRRPPSSQRRLNLGGNEDDDWEYPDTDLLQEVPADTASARPDESTLRKNAEFLQTVLADFNIQGEIVSINPGPVVTLYELEPAPGTKTSRVISLADDIARSMSAVSVRCAVVPGRNVIGIELPNKRRETVYMRELLTSREVDKVSAKLPLVLGKDIGGAPVVADLARMPHLLVAGTTGSGKSVAINTMILSLLYRLSPEQCRFIMIDPKMLELSVYDDIPHLLAPVVTEPGKAVVSLKWAVQEMEERYRSMSKLGVRNIEGYNARLAEARRKGEALMRKVQTGFDPDTGKPVYEEQPLDLTDLPYIVIVVDEFADLMLVAGKDVEGAVQRLAQMARAAGIHLIMATQRPSVDVITGVIKANFPTRISFQVTSKIDSRTILGEGGAEQLLGMGDMLYMAPGGRITRVHGPFVSDRDVQNVVDFLKAQAEPDYLEEVTEGGGYGDSEVMEALFGGGEGGEGSNVDEFYDQAVALVAREGKASTSFVQRYFQIGYNRAARIIEEMERQGVISKASPTGKRDVLVGDYSDV